MRPLPKRLLASALRTYVVASKRRVGVALLYHGINTQVRARADELVPSVSLEVFDQQIEHLALHYTAVTASELWEAASTRRHRVRIPIAVTFDDDDPSYVERVVPVLRRHGVPATFFLNGASLNKARWFWWELCQEAWDRGLIDKDFIATISDHRLAAEACARRPLIALGDAIARMAPRDVERVEAALLSRLGGPPTGGRMHAEHVRVLAQHGHEIGFHTRSHPFLPALDRTALQEALTDGREALEAIVGLRLRVFAYPSGGVTTDIVDEARRAGYAYAFTTQKRAVEVAADRLTLGRIVPPRDSAGSLSWEIARTVAGYPRD